MRPLIRLGVLALAVCHVACLTNKEFYEFAVANGAEILGEEDPNVSYVSSDEDYDVIELPGGPDEELDIPLLLQKMADQEDEQEEADDVMTDVGWWHKKKKKKKRRRKPVCSCRKYMCKCCIKKTYKVNLIFKKIRFNFKPCVSFGYLPRNYGFVLTITFNGRRLYHKEISLKHPPALCFGVPGLRRFARVCVEIYNVNLRTKHICVRLAGVIDLKVKKFRVHLKIACFRIPILDERSITEIVDPSNLEIEVVPTEHDEVETSEELDLAELFRSLQMAEISNDGVEDLY